MRTEFLNLEKTEFAFVKGNRPTDGKRLEKAIRAAGQVLIPIYGVFYGDIKDSGIEIFDALTGELLNTPSDDCFVVLDGQHRTKALLNIFKENQERLSKSEASDASETDFAKTIPATVLGADDIKDVNLLERIMNINTTSKSWTSKDFAYSAHELKKDDVILLLIYWLINLGFSLSNISRILFFDHKALNNQILSDYANGKGELPECNLKSKLELFRMLLILGFDLEFLRKRYLYEAIIKKNNAQKYDEFVNTLCQLDEATVKQIEQLSPVECDNGKIIEIVTRFAKNTDIRRDSTSFSFDLSEERFNENVESIRIMFEDAESNRQKNKKARGTKNNEAKQKKHANVESCTLEDVV